MYTRPLKPSTHKPSGRDGRPRHLLDEETAKAFDRRSPGASARDARTPTDKFRFRVGTAKACIFGGVIPYIT